MSDMTADELRALLLSLLGSLTLCDHQGDVGDDVMTVLERLGIEVAQDGDSWEEDVRHALAAMGVRTLYDSSLADD